MNKFSNIYHCPRASSSMGPHATATSKEPSYVSKQY